MTNILAQKAVLASVTIRRWTGRRLDREVTDEINESRHAEADAGRYNKLLIPRAAFAPVTEAVHRARAEHHRMTQPWLDDGTGILPTALYDQFAARFRELRTEFNAAADQFAREYPAHLKAAPKRLNGMFKAEDYPTPDRVRGMFDMHVRIFPCPDTEDFRVKLAKEQADDIRQDLKSELEAALQEAMKEPVRRIIDVVGHMAERLKAYKPKTDTDRAENTFRDSLVGNVRDLTEILPAFNLTGDKVLTQLTRRMEKELCPQEPDTLREDELVRATTAKAAEEIVKQAQALMG